LVFVESHQVRFVVAKDARFVGRLAESFDKDFTVFSGCVGTEQVGKIEKQTQEMLAIAILATDLNERHKLMAYREMFYRSLKVGRSTIHRSRQFATLCGLY
jgi:hypothetical protein